MRSKGFSVVELAILLAIIGILTVVAIPDYLKFQKRSDQAEAKTNLGAIFTYQVAYYGEYSTYSGGPCCFEQLGWAPEGDTIYTYDCDQEDQINPTKGCAKGPCVKPTACSVIMSEVTQTTFTMCASGNIDRDGIPDEWIMPDSKNLMNTFNDGSDAIDEIFPVQ